MGWGRPSQLAVEMDPDTLLKLIARLGARGGPQDLSAAINAAIELWLAEQAKLPAGCDPASVRGYQWKSLFLPEGTVLRSWSYGEHNYARVAGDQIIYEGKAVSPNEFAQSFARTTRNAWTDLYIRRPEDKQFKLASRLRQELARRPALANEQPVVPSTLPTPADAATLALIAALRAQVPTQAPPPPAAEVVPPSSLRDTTPGLGWDLPERRKFRFRLEDVAFD